ncbi:sensor histidine kinase [Dictyobacter kobayashii]|uniref:histidine kinase n=1 Tax=Dictyobacter kobayashii TaxID=2014872 RepID=A0A402AQX7_9CHLR|nr:HAMP domain-containing sensor histidine kinase [Dictyobacter kobayashii]GCE21497.1 hypothetical protein KDK_52970 [Dictyobacter kobayashii]
MTSIRGNVQLAKRQLGRIPPEEVKPESQTAQTIIEVQSFLDRAERQIIAQGHLVKDLLDASRISMEQLDLKITLCDLQKIVLEVIEDQHRLTLTRTIHFDCPVLEILVEADARRVGQVVNNYLSNALKYSDVGTPIGVRIDLLGPAVQVSVSDQGPGLSNEMQQHVWERFYRAPGIEVKSGAGIGLGLGLHICRTIIERQGGTVGVRSAPGQGSTFWFTLPLADQRMNI